MSNKRKATSSLKKMKKRKKLLKETDQDNKPGQASSKTISVAKSKRKSKRKVSKKKTLPSIEKKKLQINKQSPITTQMTKNNNNSGKNKIKHKKGNMSESFNSKNTKKLKKSKGHNVFAPKSSNYWQSKKGVNKSLPLRERTMKQSQSSSKTVSVAKAKRKSKCKISKKKASHSTEKTKPKINKQSRITTQMTKNNNNSNNNKIKHHTHAQIKHKNLNSTKTICMKSKDNKKKNISESFNSKNIKKLKRGKEHIAFSPKSSNYLQSKKGANKSLPLRERMMNQSQNSSKTVSVAKAKRKSKRTISKKKTSVSTEKTKSKINKQSPITIQMTKNNNNSNKIKHHTQAQIKHKNLSSTKTVCIKSKDNNKKNISESFSSKNINKLKRGKEHIVFAPKSSNNLQSKKGANKLLSLRERMMNQLQGARFRYINEQLYSITGDEAKTVFETDPESFKAYHAGYSLQTQSWPLNPLDVIIESVKKMPQNHIIADFGCGDAKLAKSVPQKVHSFDLIALNDCVQVCNMSSVPLDSGTVDVVVFCLSLMGTDLHNFLREANRVLKTGGILKIAEVESRFDDVNTFITTLKTFQFKIIASDLSHNLFYFIDLKKVSNINPKRILPSIYLSPCIYKKR